MEPSSSPIISTLGVPNPCVLAIDVSNLAHVGYWSAGSKGGTISIEMALHVFLHQTFMTALKYDCTHIVLCNDTPPYLRTLGGQAAEAEEAEEGEKDIDVDAISDDPNYVMTDEESVAVLAASRYKGDRKAMEDYDDVLFCHLKEAISEAASILGLNEYAVQGAESDDLIYHIANQVNAVGGRLIVYSSDSDLNPLLLMGNTVQIGTIPRRGVVSKTAGDLSEKYKFPLHWLPLYLVLTGGHNGAIKVEGLGDVTATKLLNSVPESYLSSPLEDVLDYIVRTGVVKRVRLEAYRELLFYGLTLQTFPFPGLGLESTKTPFVPLPRVSLNQADSAHFLSKKVKELASYFGIDEGNARIFYTSLDCYLRLITRTDSLPATPSVDPVSVETTPVESSSGIDWNAFV
jgi:hypothetical protein